MYCRNVRKLDAEERLWSFDLKESTNVGHSSPDPQDLFHPRLKLTATTIMGNRLDHEPVGNVSLPDVMRVTQIYVRVVEPLMRAV